MNTDDSGEFDDRLGKSLQGNGDHPSVVEGLRLIVAFRKIKDQADRRKVIELAERLAK